MRSKVHRTVRTAFLLITSIGLISMHQPVQATTAKWSMRTAQTLPKGRIEFGLIAPLRVGLSDRLELVTHPLLDPVVPNVGFKVGWPRIACWDVASTHGVSVPTPLLLLLQRPGLGGLVPPDVKVPVIVALTHGVMGTRPLGANHFFSLGMTLHTAFRSGGSTLPSFDLPLIYTRSAAWQHTVAFQARVGFNGLISRRFAYEVDLQLWGVPYDRGAFALEQAGAVTYRPSFGFGLRVGYKIVLGQYPYGWDWHILPVVDLQFGFN